MAVDAGAGSTLLLGRTGQVGFELVRALEPQGNLIALDRAAADFSRPESLREVIRRIAPRTIVNAAAYTAVDRAESEPDLATLVNAEAPRILAEEAEKLGAILVHYSTDYVFDGGKTGFYMEGDATRPLGIYGRTKLAGEKAVAAACRRHLIFRTSWVFGAHGANFIKTMLRLAAERDALRVVADQHGAPTSASLIARVTGEVLTAMKDAPASDRRWGVYHLAPAGETTWHALAERVLARARERGLRLKAGPEQVAAITTAEYPTAAPRPRNSKMDTRRLRDTFGIRLPDWGADVDAVVDQLIPARTH